MRISSFRVDLGNGVGCGGRRLALFWGEKALSLGNPQRDLD
jgi:hypothetical protein